MLRKKYYLFLIISAFILISCDPYSKDKNKISIGFSQSISEDDSWRKSMDYTMKLEASLHPEIDLTICNANNNTQRQIQDIEKMIEKHLDAIIVAPYGSDSIVPVIEKAYKKGIPVIIVDRKVNTPFFTAFLGTDNVEVGRIAGKHIVSISKANANVLEIRATTDISPGVERSLGFKQIMDRYPGIKKVSITAADLESLNAKFSRALDSLPKLDYVFAFNDNIALQAWQVAKQKGRENKIKFIGIDGLNGPNGGIQAVKDGMLAATILYPTGGSEAIKLAVKLVNKESVSKNNKLATVLIDSLNADIMSNQFDKISQQQSNIDTQLKVIDKQERKYITLYNLMKLLGFFSVAIFCLALFSVYSVISIRRKKRQLELTNQKIKNQRNQIEKFAEKLKISNEGKINFFTGISHEFKTPLTLILSCVESLNDEFKSKSYNVKKDLDIMYNNSMRLLRLINQLLDFRKIESKNFNIKVSKTNLWFFSKNLFKEFEREANKRNIEYTITTNDEDLEVYLDKNLMDKVYYNLLSNSFKFTPDGGKIEIKINKNLEKNSVEITFKDSGIGIPKNEINEIFNPFFKGSNNYKNGSGIGLNLSKSFIDLHKGAIEVKSDKGTEFIISLKLGTEHLDKKQIINDTDYVYENHDEYFDIEPIKDKNQLAEENDKKYSILIIEDNVELLEFIAAKLSDEYNVLKSDGKNATEIALEVMPDIILCDLNLPEKNGFEICETLKKNILTSHIPTIILTAMDDEETYIKSLEAGADLFLTKPFNLKVLKQSIKGLLYNREKLRYYYTNNIGELEVNTLGIIEKKFLNKIEALLEKNIDNSSFSVEDLANCLNISRVQLYRKVKAVLGIGVSDYITNYRLEKSKELLKTTSLNISEIAYSCGFTSPNYFSTTFKSKYSISPKEFRNNK
ncbi:monosaccharide ABC transporter substrate-binding protein, CUT2 family [Flavobacterium glycines]|uniref:histidine kinase n=1 Tax=Flavobacterium glycines TaxID=551990 RepID=A0A1B9DRI3_9FLAO|nr:substrate-binding domain-containing protein [Flavobacterium glycines]OCB72296.1 AraC family transcriptional regulator [Flavobacterium glycines]GEL09763.1 sensor histidine kinase [Flavobacterium glycines]SDI94629.1 monosaccharide ABC transporter substrate-binding protein, CUT2 family [Flavobacterium glycines]